MAHGLQVFNAAGSLVWDSSTVVGGIFADFREFASGASGTLSYTSFPGAQAAVVSMLPTDSGTGATVDTSLGYPRVIVGSTSSTRRFAVMLF